MQANVHNLGLQDSALSSFMAEIRDKNIQLDSLRFNS